MITLPVPYWGKWLHNPSHEKVPVVWNRPFTSAVHDNEGSIGNT